jgi:DNA-directed RNA polymerase specialized sigma24 family protein
MTRRLLPATFGETRCPLYAMTTAEIAAELGIRERSVRETIERAIRKLRHNALARQLYQENAK